MIDRTRMRPDKGTSDDLLDVFGGFNEGYAVSLLDGEDADLAVNGLDVIDAEVEYDGLLMDPDFLSREVVIIDRKSESRAELEEEHVDTGDEDVSTEDAIDIESAVADDESAIEEDDEFLEPAEPSIEEDEESASAVSGVDVEEAAVSVDQIVRVERLINAIREDGHQAAGIDPLKMLPRTEEHLSPDPLRCSP